MGIGIGNIGIIYPFIGTLRNMPLLYIKVGIREVVGPVPCGKTITYTVDLPVICRNNIIYGVIGDRAIIIYIPEP
jgi:hypothetical protein